MFILYLQRKDQKNFQAERENGKFLLNDFIWITTCCYSHGHIFSYAYGHIFSYSYGHIFVSLW